MKKIKKIVFVIFVVLLLSGLAGTISLLYAGNKKDFYLKFKGETIAESENEIVLSIYEENKFQVKSVIPFTSQEYQVRIYSKIDKENNFEYIMNGNRYNYENNLDLTSAFEIDCNEKEFTINLRTVLIEDVLKKYYNTSNLYLNTSQENIPDTTKNVYFKLVISSKKNRININFKTDKIPVLDLNVDKDEVVF